jgi:hypothetical protein
MVPVPSPVSSQPIPSNLKSQLLNPQTPWNVSPTLFGRIQAQASDQPFRLCEVLNTDPEFNFILKYFEHQKPPGYSIKRIVCIHNSDHTQVFEGTLKNQERESSNPVFAPKGKEEEPKADRARVITRWEAQVSQFSPVEIKSANSRQSDVCSKAKVLPLWHGSSEFECKSVCSSGFSFFGKHQNFDESAHQGSRDKGYFGSGVYFTNSAQYATMYSSEGHLLLSWVSMREPYPVVNDKPHPQKGSDMIKLEGKEHYQNYNTHFIPIASIRSQDPQCLEYYPCYKDQQPAWDEFVVFYPAQALPRFLVELGVDFPKVALSQMTNVGEFLTFNEAAAPSNPKLKSAPVTQVPAIPQPSKSTHAVPFVKKGALYLGDVAKQLRPAGEKLSSATANMLLKVGSVPPSAAPVKAQPPISVVTLAPALAEAPVKPVFPAMAFGKEKWAIHIGDVGIEPPLPPDIDKILKSPCPFFPGKKVEETHLLTLIPKTVNGKPLTLNSLEELMKLPKKGIATRYVSYRDGIKKEHGDAAPSFSYWVLFTKDVIPESRKKSYNKQKKLVASYSHKAHVLYEVPRLLEAAVSIFMEYLLTGQRLYSDSPWTFTRCQERISEHPNWPLVVGGFAVGGLHVINFDDREDSGVGSLRKL